MRLVGTFSEQNEAVAAPTLLQSAFGIREQDLVGPKITWSSVIGISGLKANESLGYG